MCGITLSITPASTHPSSSTLHESLTAANAQRGPNSTNTYRNNFHLANDQKVELVLTSSVLGLRGDLTQQPMTGKRGVLAWNGQVFEGLDIQVGANDTRVIFEHLEAGESLEDVLCQVEGPYACVYYDIIRQTVSFQVDPLTRRSLLISLPSATSPSFILTSTRSMLARERDVSIRALLGGEGGVIHLDKIRLSDRTMALADALEMRACLPGPSTWTRIQPINTTLPPPGLLPSETYAQAEVERFEQELLRAVRSRVDNIPNPSPGNARVAILFSGGVDCTLLAYMVHLCIPPDEPIELINVAFQRSSSTSDGSGAKGWSKPPKHKSPVESNGSIDAGSASDEATPREGSKARDATYDTPDRISGYDALSELRASCSGREWRFVEVNVAYEEYHKHRQKVVDLMYPGTTEMDLSLAYPLYFASRGIGFLDGRPYTVQSKVYISGLGADEQLGGYARHRHAYSQSSYPGLLTSLQTDIDTLPIRNTSRDDRVLSSHARDARYPYLSLSFIRYLSQTPIWSKVYYEAGEGWGDKLLLRLAADRAGLTYTARRVKRAMQFGSRSAKVDGGVKGKAAGTRAITER